jgi:hypothetical protein
VGGYQEIVKPLLDKRADVDAQSANTGTGSVTIVPTLSGRVKDSHQEIFKLLLDKGADVNALGGCYGCALQRPSRYS